MGGIGSGNRSQWSTTTTLEETIRIDIRYLKKNRLLRAGNAGRLSWTSGSSINYQCFDQLLQLSYKHKSSEGEWLSVKQDIRFDRTPCHFGGKRLWFLCPNCHRRVAVLSGYGKRFLCRHCYQLPYASQNEGRLDRLISQKHKLGVRIFEYYEFGEGWGKKKGMHWRTFERLQKVYKELDDSINRSIYGRLRLIDDLRLTSSS